MVATTALTGVGATASVGRAFCRRRRPSSELQQRQALSLLLEAGLDELENALADVRRGLLSSLEQREQALPEAEGHAVALAEQFELGVVFHGGARS